MNQLARARRWLRWLPHKFYYKRGLRWASEWRKFYVKLLHPNAHIEFGPGTYVGPGFSLEMREGGAFITGKNCHFRRGFHAQIAGSGKIVFADRSGTTYDVLMQCTTSIHVGERVMIGQNTLILDGHHNFKDNTKPIWEQGYRFEPRTIGKDAQIFSKAAILADVGERAIIAANAVVHKPAPPWTVIGGVPGRILDYYGPPGQEPPGWEPRKRLPSEPDAA